MKNMLQKGNSRKVNVSKCGTLDCYEKQTDKEAEIYKPVSEDTPPQIEPNKENYSLAATKEISLSSSSTSAGSVAETNTPSSDNKMVQEETNNVNDGADEQMLGAEDGEKLAGKREEVKFIKGDHQNGDAKIDIGAVNGKAFTGMTKEELMKYANDPFWIRLRWIFFIAFWLIWLGMLVGAILIIVGAPKCAAPEPLPWYKRGVLAKFNNFDVSKDDVEVVKQIEATGAIYEMPAELTYNVHEAAVEEKVRDIVNHYKDTDVHVILDVTANYVPKTSRLMQEAMVDESKRSAFIWISKSTPPNNWVSLVNGSAWFEVSKGNYVLSQFGDGLYDLHMNDTLVKKELDDVLKHLIELGVRGIRLKNSKFFLLSKHIQDEVPGADPKYDSTQYGFWTHSQTTFQEGLGDILYGYLSAVKNVSADSFLSVADDIIRPDVYRTNSGEMGIDLPMYGNFVKNLGSPKDKPLRSELINIMREAGNHTWLQWNVGAVSADSEVNPSAITLFLSLLPGTPVLSVGSQESGNLTESMYKSIGQFRMSPSYMHGDFDMLSVEPLLAYTRIKAGNPGYLVVFNPTDVNQKANLTSDSLPEQLTVVTASDNYNVSHIGQKSGQRIGHNELELSPYSTIILTYVSKKTD